MGNTKMKAKENLILSEEDINTLMASTSFGREEILKWHEGFIRDCPNGVLNKNQFMDVYHVFYPQGKADKFCKHVYKVFNDGTGTIDFKQFLVAIAVTAAGDPWKKLSLAFNMYDVDKNQQVDRKEMEKIIEAIYDLLGEDRRKDRHSPANRTKVIMQKFDKGNSGFLNEKEFVEGCLDDPVLRLLLVPNA